MAVGKIGIDNYIMFGEIKEIVEGFYNTSVASDDWQSIIDVVVANGVLGDLDSNYHSLTLLSNLAETDELRNFPTQPSTISARFLGAETTTLTSGKSNTIFFDLAENTIDETSGLYSCTYGHSSYSGLGGFVEYTASATDISNYGTMVLCIDIFTQAGAEKIYTNQVDITASGSANKGLINFDISPFLSKKCTVVTRLKDKSALATYSVDGVVKELDLGGTQTDVINGTTTVTARGQGGNAGVTALNHTSVEGQSVTATTLTTGTDSDIVVSVVYTKPSGVYGFEGGVTRDLLAQINLYERTSGGGKGNLVRSVFSSVILGGLTAETITFKSLSAKPSEFGVDGLYYEVIVGSRRDFFDDPLLFLL